jgi:hypothetical protein
VCVCECICLLCVFVREYDWNQLLWSITVNDLLKNVCVFTHAEVCVSVQTCRCVCVFIHAGVCVCVCVYTCRCVCVFFFVLPQFISLYVVNSSHPVERVYLIVSWILSCILSCNQQLRLLIVVTLIAGVQCVRVLCACFHFICIIYSVNICAVHSVCECSLFRRVLEYTSYGISIHVLRDDRFIRAIDELYPLYSFGLYLF